MPAVADRAWVPGGRARNPMPTPGGPGLPASRAPEFQVFRNRSRQFFLRRWPLDRQAFSPANLAYQISQTKAIRAAHCPNATFRGYASLIPPTRPDTTKHTIPGGPPSLSPAVRGAPSRPVSGLLSASRDMLAGRFPGLLSAGLGLPPAVSGALSADLQASSPADFRLLPADRLRLICGRPTRRRLRLGVAGAIAPALPAGTTRWLRAEGGLQPAWRHGGTCAVAYGMGLVKN